MWQRTQKHNGQITCLDLKSNSGHSCRQSFTHLAKPSQSNVNLADDVTHLGNTCRRFVRRWQKLSQKKDASALEHKENSLACKRKPSKPLVPLDAKNAPSTPTPFNISLQHGVSPWEIFEHLNENCKKTCTSSLLRRFQH